MQNLRKDLLRSCSKDMNKEPSDLINTILQDSGKTVWLLSPDFNVLWHSDNIEEVTGRSGSYYGGDYEYQMPQLRAFIESLCEGSYSKCSSVFKQGIREYEVVAHPIVTEGQVTGYVVTLTEGFKAKLRKLIEKQKVRENKLCQISGSLPQLS